MTFPTGSADDSNEGNESSSGSDNASGSDNTASSDASADSGSNAAADGDKGKAPDVPSVETNPSWGAAIDAYMARPGLTENTLRTNRTTLCGFSHDHVPEEVRGPAGVSPDLIRAYLGRESISQAYRLSLYSRLNAFYSWLVEQGAITPQENPMDAIGRPETPSKERAYLTPTQFTRLVEAIRRDYEERVEAGGRKSIREGEIIWALPPLRFGAGTGLRPSAMKRLRVEDVDFEEETLRVPALEEGSGIDREIPLCPLALEAAREAARGKIGTDYLFSGARSEQIDTRRLSRTIKRYLRETGIGPEMNFTDCTRHTCASWLTILGYPSPDVRKMLGHSSAKSTEPYHHLGPSMDDLRGEPSAHYQAFSEAMEEIGFFPPIMKL